MSDVNIYKEYEAPSGGGGPWLKLEDGKPTKLRIASEPYIFRDVFKDQTTGKERESVRYAWVAVDVTAEPVAGILRLPVTGFKNLQVFAADDEYGDPINYGISITRKGTGKQTEYMVVPSPKAVPLSDELKALSLGVDLTKAIPNAITLVEAHAGKPLPKANETAADTVAPTGLPDNDTIDLSDIPF